MRAAGEAVIRTATPGDAAAVLARVHSAYRGDESRRGWTTEADYLDGQRTDLAGVEALIAADDGLLLVAEVSGAIAGCVHLDLMGELPSLGLLAVDPELQSGGLGRRLVEAVERAAAAHGAGALRLRVLEGRAELIAWYLRLGYILTGATAPFPYGDERVGRPKRNDLRFLVMRKMLQS